MLNIHTLTLGDYGTNCYIVHDSASKTCCVINPGYTPEKVLSEVNALGLTVEAILLTHGHFDHVGGVREIAAETGCDVYLCADELTMPPQMTAPPVLVRVRIAVVRFPPRKVPLYILSYISATTTSPSTRESMTHWL